MMNIFSMSHRYTSVLGLVFGVFVTACSSSPQLDVTIQQSARSGVYLERIPTRQFHATHPIRLAPELIAKSLQGVQIEEGKGLLQSLSAQQNRTLSVFSQDDITLLAPAIADGLSQAAPDQQVGFRIVQKEHFEGRDRTGAGVGSGTAPQRNQESTTSGKLFVYGRSLYLTIHQFRYHTEPPDTINMPNRRLSEPTGLRNRTVLFMPQSALRPDIYTPPFAAENGLTTLVIDYDALAKAPTAAVPPPPAVSAPTPAVAPAAIPATTLPLHDDVQQIKNQMKQKEREVEELRKELEEIKRQLSNPSTKGGQSPSNKP
ncbi:MAG: hypothetical protein LZF60_300019 [Nitrospira sp.]|nr:MAG: hypothetical protein LZF60_300019 [Nitrospira sp.]